MIEKPQAEESLSAKRRAHPSNLINQWEEGVIAEDIDDDTSCTEEIEDLYDLRLDEYLGKRTRLLTDGLFSTKEIESLERILDRRKEFLLRTSEEADKIRDIGKNSGSGSVYIELILSHEVMMANSRSASELPVCYMDLNGYNDIEVPPQNRKRFMPLCFRDNSKILHDDEVRQQERQEFLRKSGWFGYEMPKFDKNQWKRNISAGMLRESQKNKPEEDRKALTPAERKAKERAKKRELTPEDWAVKKKEKAEEKKIQRKEKKLDAQRARRENTKSTKTDLESTIDC